jgi:hypothetical protein
MAEPNLFPPVSSMDTLGYMSQIHNKNMYVLPELFYVETLCLCVFLYRIAFFALMESG